VEDEGALQDWYAYGMSNIVIGWMAASGLLVILEVLKVLLDHM
jgi:hypothetical protein